MKIGLRVRRCTQLGLSGVICLTYVHAETAFGLIIYVKSTGTRLGPGRLTGLGIASSGGRQRNRSRRAGNSVGARWRSAGADRQAAGGWQLPGTFVSAGPGSRWLAQAGACCPSTSVCAPDAGENASQWGQTANPLNAQTVGVVDRVRWSSLRVKLRLIFLVSSQRARS